MLKYSILWASILALFLGGCAPKHYSISTPKLIVIKTPKLKFSDMGYLRYEGDAVEMELFTAGVAVEKISLDSKVCVSAGCMNEERFTQTYLNPAYPSDTMRQVLQNHAIFRGEGMNESVGEVTTQRIRTDKIDILYRHSPTEIYFNDRLNGIMIKILDVTEDNGTQ